MIDFVLAITLTTAIFSSAFYFIKKKVVSHYRGGMFIILSGFYFSAIFVIAHLMREHFK
jgi:hypothetical protein